MAFRDSAGQGGETHSDSHCPHRLADLLLPDESRRGDSDASTAGNSSMTGNWTCPAGPPKPI